jgi:transcription elongation factor Elf1
MRMKIHSYDCPKCQEQNSVPTTLTDKKEWIEFKVGKCKTCGYQPDPDEILKPSNH